ncbi:MAG: mechanosensitive ion channel [Methanocellales archaeon]|nr:mechanosensitive ion channel [Methanocellales archaeon]
MGKIVNLVILIILAITSIGINIILEDINLDKVTYTMFALVMVYIIGKIITEEALIKKIKQSKSRYSTRKVINIISVIIALIIVSNIWVSDPKNLLVTYGIVGAGLAIALQDIVKNFVGGLILVINRYYRVGDRIEINSVTGDVIDIGVLSTTLLELNEWVNGDQATGRIITIPNGQIISQNIISFTRDHNFIWDEISIPLTHDSDWKKAIQELNSLLIEETKDSSALAEKDISKLEEKFYLERRPTSPSIYLELTDNWIMLQMRYISIVRERRKTKDDIYRKIVSLLDGLKNVEIASESYDIRLKKEDGLLTK